MSKEANSIGKCPLCGSAVEDKAKAFFCSNRACKFALWKNNRYFASIGKSMTSATAQKLLGSGKVKLKNCKSERTGNTFDATVFMEVSDDGKTKFSMEFENDGEFISSYECDPKTADEEFLLSKRQYQHITGRQQKNNIIASSSSQTGFP